MAVLLPSTPTILSTPFANRTTTHLPLRHHSHTFSPSTKRFLRGSLSVARFGFQPGFLPEPDDAQFVIKELFNRAEGFLYTIADATVLSSDTVVTTAKQNNNLLSLISDFVETVLKVLTYGLSTLHVPNAYGFSIVMLAVLVNAAIFPLTRKQVESDMAMRSLKPQLEAIVKQYSGNSKKKNTKQYVEDLERIKLETDRLYKLANIDPLSGFRPVLLTTPVWIGLYQAFSKMADGGPLSEGFFWIPSLSGPTTIAAQQNGNGISWLFPFVDGHPLLGWPDTLAYLVLPVLLVVSRYISLQIIPSSEGLPVYTKTLKKGDWPLGKTLNFVIKVNIPKVKSSQKAFDVNFQGTDPNVESSKVLDNILLSLVFGCFALLVPSGLSLYWFTDNILNTLQQIWLQKLGGAKNPLGQVLDDNVKNDPMQI
ncbi:63 kDa inner membrane family protein [Trifolium repens]|nr:63 kDa inner membrane family protein [Trifolium repens]